jgi:hydroxymethylpyrimidine pyrophosphatase-like HAD family hydrolase
VDADHTIAIGNYFNVVEMIRMSGLGVAVANAPEEVKRQADLVTDSNNDEGVRKILEKYVLTPVEKGEKR